MSALRLKTKSNFADVITGKSDASVARQRLLTDALTFDAAARVRAFVAWRVLRLLTATIICIDGAAQQITGERIDLVGILMRQIERLPAVVLCAILVLQGQRHEGES